MAERATCRGYGRVVKAVSPRLSGQSVLRPDLPTGGADTQVESGPKHQATDVQPGGHAAAHVRHCASTRGETLEGVAEYAFRRYREQVYRYLRGRACSRDQAEELTQQVFADAAAALARMESCPVSVIALLYTIARRRFADELRRQRQSCEQVSLDDAVQRPSNPEYGSAVGRAIRDGISQLPSEQRRVVSMKLIAGCSFSEIATVVGGTEAAAKMRFQRGLDTLRRDLERQGLQPEAA